MSSSIPKVVLSILIMEESTETSSQNRKLMMTKHFSPTHNDRNFAVWYSPISLKAQLKGKSFT